MRNAVWKLSTAGALVVGSGLMVVSAAVAGPGGGTPLFNETFQGSTATAPLTLPPSLNGAANDACLTASSDTTQTPIPGCGLTPPDASGSGALRLTGAVGALVGGAFSNLSVPASSGLDDNFTLYQYGSTTPSDPADGIGFVINAENPSDPTPPSIIGRSGGSLGYSASYPGTPGTDGLSDGYLGVGFDTYGNFSGSGYEGTGCTNPSWINTNEQNQVVTRGPGNLMEGYCPLESSSDVYGGSQAIGSTSASRAAAAMPAEVVINTTGSAYTMTGANFGAITVPAGDYGVAWEPIGGTAKSYTGALPSTTNGGIPADLYPASWVNPTTGIPYQLGFGWVGSTGSFTNVHEVTNAVSTTITPVPVLSAAVTDGQSGSLPLGGTATYSLTAGVTSSGAAESQPVTMSATFPSGVTPGSATGTGWTCTTSAQDVSCTYPGSPTIPAGQILPKVTLAAAVSATASTAPGALATSLTVSSNDGDPAQATDTASAVVAPTTTPVTANVSGTQVAGSSTPSFSQTSAPPAGITLAGNVVCTTVDGGTPISPTLAPGDYTIDGSSCHGLSPSGTGAGAYTVSYVGVHNGFVVTGTYNPNGYRFDGTDGGVFDFGIQFGGSLYGHPLHAPIVGLSNEPGPDGYLLVGADGGVFSFGGAAYFGSLGGQSLPTPIAAIATTPDGKGYWLVSTTGKVYPFGDAPSLPSITVHLNAPIVGAAATAAGGGLQLVAADGGVFSLGTAVFEGSMGGRTLTKPIVGIAAAPSGNGYTLTASDGGVFAFNTPYLGSTATLHLAAPIVGIAATNSGHGYWLVGADGGIFAYGDAPYLGSMAGTHLSGPIVAISHLGNNPGA